MFRTVTLLYSLLYTLGLLFYGPIRVVQTLIRGQKVGLIARLKPPDPIQAPSSRQTIWIHAVSVGEVNAVKPLAAELMRRNFILHISTITETGQEQAKAIFGEQAKIFYFPLDWKRVCRRFLKKIDPDIIILVETELWPNFISAAREQKIPLVLVNGRISDSSFRYYSRIRFLLQPLLESFTYLCVQSNQDQQRILALGAPIERTECVGNLKFDYQLVRNPEKEVLKNSLMTIIKRDPASLLLICGSTKPGEEEPLLSAFVSLRSEFPNLYLLLAPRHPHRGNEVTQLASDKNLRVLQRSQDGFDVTRGGEVDVVVLDSIGELSTLYQAGDLVFIGGSLVPEGGQNVIEPAACGKPILFGPHMENFRQIAEVFIRAGAAIQVPSIQEFEKECRNLLRQRELREDLGQRAMKVVTLNRGAVERTVGILQRLSSEKTE